MKAFELKTGEADMIVYPFNPHGYAFGIGRSPQSSQETPERKTADSPATVEGASNKQCAKELNFDTQSSGSGVNEKQLPPKPSSQQLQIPEGTPPGESFNWSFDYNESITKGSCEIEIPTTGMLQPERLSRSISKKRILFYRLLLNLHRNTSQSSPWQTRQRLTLY